MHIAICDDNVADRKQLERLLQRESDKRSSTSGVFYIDSYGHPESLLQNPMQYDAIFVDVCKTPDFTAEAFVKALIQKHDSAFIIMCCSEINYRTHDFAEETYFLDKPIKVAELSAALDEALKAKENSTPVIELREEKQTLFVLEEEILYGIQSGHRFEVTLTDGRVSNIPTSAENFFRENEHYPSFVCPRETVVINIRHIAKIRFGIAIMADGTKFPIGARVLAYCKKVLKELNAETR